ncbi:alpha/beta hydrolase [Actinacidiphila acididurans]|uniref:Alpha/beta fold hydrolase n=1 Tax=Actinacidiphila acididurans TaxID=2784346 RepID=A0ABS2TYN8_9ACTN|nr:alpha/beta fold hydrolase [Actinacidiphila acididurans]MBM9508449.1 alpha/beta fold hydrolase [Actinacidiphila acididurans]
MNSPAETDDERLRVSVTTSGGRRAVLLTTDGVAVEAEHHPPRGGSGHVEQLAVVVAHGFTGALDRPAIRAAAEHFTGYGGVVTFSFRGHGRSGGRSTVGDLEVLDLDAAVAWARSLGYPKVATVGFSMGGSVVLRQAGRAEPVPDRVRPDAVVAVSSPARWYYRGTAPMRRLHWVVTRPAGRLVSRVGLHTRIHPREWDPVPPSPVESVPYIAPTPLLVVHGDRDGYFPLDHPLSLAAAADPASSELWIERGFGHAENAADPALLSRIGDWLADRVPPPGPGRAMMDAGTGTMDAGTETRDRHLRAAGPDDS